MDIVYVYYFVGSLVAVAGVLRWVLYKQMGLRYKSSNSITCRVDFCGESSPFFVVKLFGKFRFFFVSDEWW